MLYVDGHPLPYAVNQTISYPSDGRRMPYLVQRLRVDDINVERSVSDDSVRYDLTTTIGKGKCRPSYSDDDDDSHQVILKHYEHN